MINVLVWAMLSLHWITIGYLNSSKEDKTVSWISISTSVICIIIFINQVINLVLL